MDLGNFVGQEINNAKQELEKLGYSVIILNNSLKSTELSLVVRAKFISDNTIELTTGDFTFLS